MKSAISRRRFRLVERNQRLIEIRICNVQYLRGFWPSHLQSASFSKRKYHKRAIHHHGSDAFHLEMRAKVPCSQLLLISGRRRPSVSMQPRGHMVIISGPYTYSATCCTTHVLQYTRAILQLPGLQDMPLPDAATGQLAPCPECVASAVSLRLRHSRKRLAFSNRPERQSRADAFTCKLQLPFFFFFPPEVREC